ncbi:cysteine-rich receptor-like protein kinase 10 [Juglans microcarpa x Juglans regia]|uniref:cysteine-rich receptor-like protein kinase 10 n=1 Tax=Juglans microcarpa x Juglans regia TaxID=2249226 RepID=UPI001B7F279A|nr:cysteine-rich receptor-like protein kinase 10 [Juglans microcarpa x Juglans regia]
MNHPHISPRLIRLLTFSAFLAFLLWELAYADPPYSFCPETSAGYIDGSPFKNNLDELLSLSLSASSSSKFYNTSTGNGADRVYGVHMCLDYVTNEDCGKCIATATKDILNLCPYTREAVVWEELCQLRYSNQNFFGQVNVTGNRDQHNSQNISEPSHFNSVVKETLNNLTTEAAAFNLSAKMYATGEVEYFEDKTIYALVQCTRDLSGDGCNSCLKKAIADVLKCCYFSIGARLFSPSCFLRYEFYNFYGATSSVNGQGSGSGGRKIWMNMIIIIVVSACFAMVLFASSIYCLANKKARKRKKEVVCQRANNSTNPSVSRFHHRNFQGRYEPQAQDFPYIELASIQAATDNFSDSNKLGEGGFGPVYKGLLSDGKEVAVKRLSFGSEQGSEEFTNEVLLIMKLQHKNLVKLLGFCVEGEERLLVYEFMPNSSLDVFLFDRSRCAQLSWSRRLNIIDGIARGILYLHQDSRLRIIHRDIKPSNVLLDNDMNPKISDFGMARIFAGSEGEANNTAKIAGTYGYMAPEYAMDGLYSIKSDVFSFGVLLIEIMSGTRNAGFHQSKRAPSLLAYAWQVWNEGKAMELLDPLLIDSCCEDDFLRYIHVGLLCAQEDANYRPTMSSVVAMLKSEPGTLCQPERPAFCVGRFIDHDETDPDRLSFNGLSISNIGPR